MPYADIAAFLFLLLSGALALAHSDEWPSGNAWSKGHPLLLAQLLVFVLLGLTQLAILISGRRVQRSEGREKACQLVAAYVDEHCPQVQLRNVGVHIWTVAGPPFARYLRRSGNFLLAGERERSGIVWVKGKGVVGATWEEGRPITRDIDAIREKAVSREAYEALGGEDTMGLRWEEFGRRIRPSLTSSGYAKVTPRTSIEGRAMTAEQKAEARRRSAEGTGPRIVPEWYVKQLEESHASKSIIKAARRALKTNPV
jgi:hypothetical protein